MYVHTHLLVNVISFNSNHQICSTNDDKVDNNNDATYETTKYSMTWPFSSFVSEQTLVTPL